MAQLALPSRVASHEWIRAPLPPLSSPNAPVVVVNRRPDSSSRPMPCLAGRPCWNVRRFHLFPPSWRSWRPGGSIPFPPPNTQHPTPSTRGVELPQRHPPGPEQGGLQRGGVPCEAGGEERVPAFGVRLRPGGGL